MRPTLLLTVMLIACGGSSKPAPVELAPLEPDEPEAGVIEVAELPQLAGFSSTSWRYVSGGAYGVGADGGLTSDTSSTTLDRTYSVRVSPDKLTVTFQAATDVRDGTTAPSPLVGKSYDLTAGGVAHSDGTALSAEETAGLTEFVQVGGLGLPVRDALVGKRLEKGKQASLTAMELANLVVTGTPEDATAWIVLDGVDADGLASFTFEGKGTIPQFNGSWSIKGTVTAEAATLNPRAIDFTISLVAGNNDTTGLSTTLSKQTFTY